MKTKLMNWLLMATLITGLGMTVTSCKDDDDDNKSEQRNEDADPLDTDQAETAWRWLSALTSAETLTSDWASKTYEPIVGSVSENNANTRIIVVSDIDEARQNFASMAGVGADELSGEKTVSQSGVGKLVWTPSAQNAENLAEVSVDIKVIPTLQKIVYCTEDQVGQNGLFTNVRGTAYYRMGDVISDREGFYWVCVRPAFEQNNKGESHWINIIEKRMPAENVYEKYNKVAKYGNRTILLPTKLKYSREHMNNLANLVWALLDPDAYAMKVGTQGTKNGLGGFDYKYHGSNFLKAVSKYWNQQRNIAIFTNTVWEALFGCTQKQMKDNLNRLTFIYKGYQWRIGNTGYVWEYTSNRNDGFQRTAPGSESADKKSYNFGGKGYDITSYCGDAYADLTIEDVPQRFGEDGHYYYVVRYKTGSELAEKSQSPYEAIPYAKDVYRYNEITYKAVRDNIETEETAGSYGQLESPQVGSIIGSDGKFYLNTRSAESYQADPAAIVVYYGEPGSVETGTNYRGLAISLKWAGNDLFTNRWSPEKLAQDCPVAMDIEEKNAETALNGLACTEVLARGCDLHHQHDAASTCWNYLKNIDNETLSHSHWFMGSVGQWILALKGIGITWDENTKEFRELDGKKISTFFEKAEVGTPIFTNRVRDSFIWTSTYSSISREAFKIICRQAGHISYVTTDIQLGGLLRPMIAF